MKGKGRRYESSHPWLTFHLELSPRSPSLWVFLGEAASKIEHVVRVPLKPDTANEFHRLYLAKGVMATTAIEGNTLSEKEVRDRLDGRLTLPRSREYLGKEVDNIAKACNAIVEREIAQDGGRLSPQVLKDYDRVVLDGLELAEGVVPGEVITSSFGVGTYRSAPPEDCEYLLEKLCSWLEGEGFVMPDRPELDLPLGIIRAILAHLYLAWIHPFGDGNGRTARLVEFHLLLRAGFPTPSAHLLSNHYNLTRTEYYRQLDSASRSGGDVIPFLLYAAQGLVDGLREQISGIQHQHLEFAWRDYVHEQIEGTSETTKRRRELVYGLSSLKHCQAKEILPSSALLAGLYGSKTMKTLTRDLNWLCEKGLVEKTAEGYRGKVELIMAFVPIRKANT